eukprot:769245-Pleurochrysis_carterae.AAC.1
MRATPRSDGDGQLRRWESRAAAFSISKSNFAQTTPPQCQRLRFRQRQERTQPHLEHLGVGVYIHTTAR